MVDELNINTVDEYTAKLDGWANSWVEKLESIPTQYATIVDGITAIDLDMSGINSKSEQNTQLYNSKVLEIYESSKEINSAFISSRALGHYISDPDKWRSNHIDSYRSLSEDDKAMVENLGILWNETNEISERYKLELSVLNNKRDELLYGNNLSKSFTKLEILGVSAAYFQNQFFKFIANKGLDEDRIMAYLNTKGFGDRIKNQLDNLDKLVKSVDKKIIEDYLEKDILQWEVMALNQEYPF